MTQRLRVVIGFRFRFFLDLGSCSCSCSCSGFGVGVGVLENGGETGKETPYTHPRNLGFDRGKKWDVWLVSWLVKGEERDLELQRPALYSFPLCPSSAPLVMPALLNVTTECPTHRQN